MGAIQSAINQAATVGAALYTQSPGFELKKQEKLNQAEVRDINQQLEKLVPGESEFWGEIPSKYPGQIGRPTKEEQLGSDFTKETELEYLNKAVGLKERKAQLTGDWDSYLRTKWELAKKTAKYSFENKGKAKIDSKQSFKNLLNETKNKGDGE